MKIDVYTHIIPKRFEEALHKKVPGSFFGSGWIDTNPTLTNLDNRFRIMDQYEGLVQVLTLGNPPVEQVVDKQGAAELAMIANDELAELLVKYPDRFVAAAACLPMNDMDAALKEFDRAVVELGLRGVEVYTPINGKPIDYPEFLPLLEKLVYYDLPIWIHPRRGSDVPDYACEDKSKYFAHSIFGWAYETTMTMTRFVFSGLFEKYPTLKVITHHSGGMVPYFAERISCNVDYNLLHMHYKYEHHLTRRPIDYFRMFYNDTAVYGNTAALMCCYAFCGAEHMMFGTDMPYDSQFGFRHVRETIRSILEMDISEAEKKLIFEDNAKRLLRLPLYRSFK